RAPCRVCCVLAIGSRILGRHGRCRADREHGRVVGGGTVSDCHLGGGQCRFGRLGGGEHRRGRRASTVVLALTGTRADHGGHPCGVGPLADALMFFRGVQDIVAPVFLALNFYIVVYPVQRALTRLKVPRAIGACLSVVLVLCMIIAFFGLTAWSVAELVILIPSYSNELVNTYQSALAM